MIYGYARVSTESQLLDLQINALKGCSIIYQEKTSGIKERPELDKLLNIVQPGDVIKIYKLDRLGRSTIDLINIVNNLKNKGVELISITDNIDTTTAAGKLIFTVFAAFAEFERNLIVERTNAGLKAARQRGQKLGPHYKWSKKTIKELQILRKQGYSVKHIAKTMSIPQSSIYKLIRLKNNSI